MPHPFDWATRCPRDVARAFPPVVGRGRGVVMGAAVGIRDTLLWLQGRDAEADPEAVRTLNARQARTYPVERADASAVADGIAFAHGAKLPGSYSGQRVDG